MVKFYLCKKCGNIVESINDKCHPVCCGEPMTELKPNTVDAAKEKHVPDVKVCGNEVVVNVGSVAHPMTEEHLIQFVVLETSMGVKRNGLKAGEAPSVKFALAEGEKAVAVYAYCNLHGLWMTAL